MDVKVKNAAMQQTKQILGNSQGVARKMISSSKSSTKTATATSQTFARRRVPQTGAGDGSIGGWSSSKSTDATATDVVYRRRLEQPTIASTMRAANNRQIVQKQKQEKSTAAPIVKDKLPMQANNRKVRETAGGAKALEKVALTTAAKNAARARLWPQQRTLNNNNENIEKIVASKKGKEREKKRNKEDDAGAAAKNLAENEKNILEANEELEDEVQRLQELGIQTNEAEILNHELLIGDIKLMTPSRLIVDEIEHAREVEKRKRQQDSTRKFKSYERHEEVHLDELKEFMERNCITKRPPKRNDMFNQTALLKSMDELLSREVPRAESFTELQQRIKRKEQELWNLFDDVDLDTKEDDD